MMASATACAGIFELSVCSDTASIPDNRLTITAPRVRRGGVRREFLS